MNVKQFIKVTPKGGKKSIVMPIGNQEFYLAQGASVETPTREEVYAAFPELAAREKAVHTNTNVNIIDGLRRDNDLLRKENQELRNKIEELSKAKETTKKGGRNKKDN